MSDLLERAESYLAHNAAESGADVLIRELVNANSALVKALEDIKQATIDGRVCDDVAWFDQITTLHDFCDQVLDHVGGRHE